jgi:prepilin-type N-terminal cleavage/methylation domain-containing protein
METSGKIGVTAINKTGFTLVEVMMAITIFSIGFLAVSTLVIATTRNNTTGNIMTQATMLARARLEQLKMAPDPTGLTDGGDTVGIFTRTWQITNPTGSAVARQLEVTVSWNRRGKNRRVVLKTITRGNGS